MKNNDLIILCAFRYALGRMSYIVGVVCDYIKDNIDIIDDKAITIMLREISEAKDNDSLGMDCDQREWLNLFRFLEDEENRRLNNKGNELTKVKMQQALDHLKQWACADNVDDLIVFMKLINEHFELLEEYKDMRRELNCYYEMMTNPKPYEFDDLKEGMFIWDSFERECIRVLKTYITDESYYNSGVRVVRIGYEEDWEEVGDEEDWNEVAFEENRFYPVQMANIKGSKQ